MILCPWSEFPSVGGKYYAACENISKFMKEGPPEQTDLFLKEFGSLLRSKIADFDKLGKDNVTSVAPCATGRSHPWTHLKLPEAGHASKTYKDLSRDAIRLLTEPLKVYEEHFGGMNEAPKVKP